MKKRIVLILAALSLVCALCLSSCSDKDGDGELSVVATVFPIYDWTSQILADVEGVSLTLLLDDGVDMHSYQPTATDFMKISSCDVFIYVGGESDAWVADALKNATNKDMTVINLFEVLSGSLLEPGQTHDHAHDHDHSHDHAHDEHVWLSLSNAKAACGAICEALSAKMPEKATALGDNAAAYCAQLLALDEEYRATVDRAARNTLLFADRFPFAYLLKDYGIEHFSAFPACSAETEASFETVAFLAAKVDELGLRHVIVIDGSSEDIARTVISNTSAKDQTVLYLDSMQSVTAERIAANQTYLSIMRANLSVLSLALN